jgi:hypothetical protein
MPVYRIRDFHWVAFESAINERRELSAHIIKGIHQHSNTKIDIYKPCIDHIEFLCRKHSKKLGNSTLSPHTHTHTQTVL